MAYDVKYPSGPKWLNERVGLILFKLAQLIYVQGGFKQQPKLEEYMPEWCKVQQSQESIAQSVRMWAQYSVAEYADMES